MSRERIFVLGRRGFGGPDLTTAARPEQRWLILEGGAVLQDQGVCRFAPPPHAPLLQTWRCAGSKSKP